MQNKPDLSATTYPAVSIGVVTHDNSFVDFASFLKELKPALAAYPGACQLVVVNNSGDNAIDQTRQQLENSTIHAVCEYCLIASPENNIAVGRNQVLDHATHSLVAFIDDDEFPTIQWLTNLVDTMQQYQCTIVAGPAIPLYLFQTPTWVKQVDLHGARGKKTGQNLDKCATANVLVDRAECAQERFNPEYGHSGGEDTDYFLKLTDQGFQLRWCNEAEVYEYIPVHKSTSKYMIKRSILQGILNREILSARGEIKYKLLFKLRSFIAVLIFFGAGGVLVCVQHPRAGDWIKRGFGNIGHLVSSHSTLYS